MHRWRPRKSSLASLYGKVLLLQIHMYFSCFRLHSGIAKSWIIPNFVFNTSVVTFLDHHLFLKIFTFMMVFKTASWHLIPILYRLQALFSLKLTSKFFVNILWSTEFEEIVALLVNLRLISEPLLNSQIKTKIRNAVHQFSLHETP